MFKSQFAHPQGGDTVEEVDDVTYQVSYDEDSWDDDDSYDEDSWDDSDDSDDDSDDSYDYS